MKKVMVFGVFDDLHEGHLELFRQAKDLGDHLTVVVAQDQTVEKLKGHSSRFGLAERMARLKSEPGVNQVIAGDTKLGSWTAIKTNHPDIIALGYDQQTLRADLEPHLSEFNPVPQIVVLSAHKPAELHSSILSQSR